MKRHELSKAIISSGIKHVTDDMISLFNNIITDGLKSKVVYTVSISNILWRIQPALAKIFPSMIETVSCDNGSIYKDGYKIWYTKDLDNNYSSRSSTEIVFYKGTPVLFRMDKISENDGSRRAWLPDAVIMTIRSEKNIRNVKELITKMIRYSNKKSKENWNNLNVLVGNGHGRLRQQIVCGHKFRTFNDVFIPDKQKKDLIESLDNFISKKDWFDENNIPYHFGIMLYGPAGTGKSSLAQAIAHHVNAELIVMSGDKILQLPEYFSNGTIQSDTMSPDTYRVLLIEDIDCGFTIHPELYNMDFNEVGNLSTDEDHNPSRKNIKGLASVLNTLDGLMAPRNTIYVFTTNHIEKLDHALIRPGRIDLKLEIGYINEETFKKFCKFHYGKEPDEHIRIRKGLTFAELQLSVMKGATMDELVKIVELEKEVC